MIRDVLSRLPLGMLEPVEIRGSHVRRSSLSGFDVDGVIGLNENEAEALVRALSSATVETADLRRAAELALAPYRLRVPTEPAALKRFGTSLHKYSAPDVQQASRLVDAVIAAEMAEACPT